MSIEFPGIILPARLKSSPTENDIYYPRATVFHANLINIDMSTIMETPDVDEACAYCGSRIFDHEPICVRDCTDDCGSPEYYCNHACLSAYIDENKLTTDDTCQWKPNERDCC